MKQITLAVPTYCRFDYFCECIEQVKDDPRIGEILVSDDCSMDGSFQKLLGKFGGNPKFTFWRNHKNLDCYRNKAVAVNQSKFDWIILFDDDNIITPAYLDRIYEYTWHPNMVYLPEFAKPHFDYRAFSGLCITRNNVGALMSRPHFPTMLNTCNFFVNKEAYQTLVDSRINPHTADSLYQNYNMLRDGKTLFVVPGLQYFHRVHEGSHYKNNVHKTGDFAKKIENLLKEMK